MAPFVQERIVGSMRWLRNLGGIVGWQCLSKDGETGDDEKKAKLTCAKVER